MHHTAMGGNRRYCVHEILLCDRTEHLDKCAPRMRLHSPAIIRVGSSKHDKICIHGAQSMSFFFISLLSVFLRRFFSHSYYRRFQMRPQLVRFVSPMLFLRPLAHCAIECS